MSKAITNLKIKGVSHPVEDAATKAEIASTNNILANTNAELASTKEELSSTKTSLANTAQSLTEFKESTTETINKIESGDSIVNKAYNDENGHNLADTLELATETKTAFEAFKTSTETALGGKVNTTTFSSNVAGVLYGVRDKNLQTVFALASPATSWTVPYRLSDGSINVGTPTTDDNATTKKYVDDKLTRAALIEVIGKATSSLDGIMSKEDKEHLDTLVALMEDDDNTVVDKIHEIIAIFNQYPEGTEIATTLSNLNTKIKNVEDNKVNTSTYNTKVGELDAEDERLAGLISGLQSSVDTLGSTKANTSAIPTKVSQLENDSSYVTSSTLSGYNYATKTDLNSYVTTAIYNNEVARLEDDIAGLQDEVETKANTSALNDYALKSSLSLKADVGASYTKTESDAKYQPKGDYATSSTLGNYATTSALNDAISGVKDDVSSMIEDSYQPKGNYVKTVNNSEPDTAGNVTITIPDYSQDISGIIDGTISVGKATKAVSDKNGNDITTTYQKKFEAGNGITIRNTSTPSISSHPITIDDVPAADSSSYDSKRLTLDNSTERLNYTSRKVNDTIIEKINDINLLPFKVDGLSVAKWEYNGYTHAYLFGGRYYDVDAGMYKYNKTVYKYNPNTVTVRAVASAPFFSENSEAVTIGDYIYVLTDNPDNDSSTSVSQIWKYDISQDKFITSYTWSGINTDITRLRNVAVAAVNDIIYIFRRDRVHRFNTTTREMTLDYMALGGFDASGGYATVFDGRIYVTGIDTTTGVDLTLVSIVINSDGSLGEYHRKQFAEYLGLKYYTGFRHNEYLFLVGGEETAYSSSTGKVLIRRINLKTGVYAIVGNYSGHLEDARGFSYVNPDNGLEYFFAIGGSDTESALDTIVVFAPDIDYTNNQLVTKSDADNYTKYSTAVYCTFTDSSLDTSNHFINIYYQASQNNAYFSVQQHLNYIASHNITATVTGYDIIAHIAGAESTDAVLTGLKVSASGIKAINIVGISEIVKKLTLMSTDVSKA